MDIRYDIRNYEYNHRYLPLVAFWMVSLSVRRPVRPFLLAKSLLFVFFFYLSMIISFYRFIKSMNTKLFLKSSCPYFQFVIVFVICPYVQLLLCFSCWTLLKPDVDIILPQHPEVPKTVFNVAILVRGSYNNLSLVP